MVHFVTCEFHHSPQVCPKRFTNADSTHRSWASIPGRDEDLIFKLLSVSPDEYSDAPTEGIRQIIELATGKSLPRGQEIPLDDVESIRMGTTVATK